MAQTTDSSRLMSPGSSESDSASEAETSSIYTPSDDENEAIGRANKGSTLRHLASSSVAHNPASPSAADTPSTPCPREPITSELDVIASIPPFPRCTNITKVKKRAYNFVNRVPAIPKKVIRKDKWISNLMSLTVTKLHATSCCSKLTCFRHVDYDHFMERARFILSTSTSTRQNILRSYHLSDRSFQFDVKRVCVMFLKKSFRFSTELDSAVRRDRRTWRSSTVSQTTIGASLSLIHI